MFSAEPASYHPNLGATASAEGRLIKGGPFPASATAEGAQLNVPPFPATASAEGRLIKGGPSPARGEGVEGPGKCMTLLLGSAPLCMWPCFLILDGLATRIDVSDDHGLR